MPVDLLVLNYNGRDLLESCLPSILAAAAESRHVCAVSVIDNASTDDSVAWLRATYPDVDVYRRSNEGLCSFNAVLRERSAPVAVLLNNDVRLRPDAVDPLVAPLLESQTYPASKRWMTAPLCWQFDERTYEGLLTSVRWRWGLVQATARFPGSERLLQHARPTASAGAVMAVRREVFLELGGFDPLFLPGRLEDLDLAYQAFLRGYEALFVPQAVAYHGGEVTFRRELGKHSSDQLAMRNTLLWQWKNLRRTSALARHVAGLSLRLAADLPRAPFQSAEDRWPTCKAFTSAIRRWQEVAPRRDAVSVARRQRCARERLFFRRFHPHSIVTGRFGSAAPETASDLTLPESRMYESLVNRDERALAAAEA